MSLLQQVVLCSGRSGLNAQVGVESEGVSELFGGRRALPKVSPRLDFLLDVGFNGLLDGVLCVEHVHERSYHFLAVFGVARPRVQLGHPMPIALAVRNELLVERPLRLIDRSADFRSVFRKVFMGQSSSHHFDVANLGRVARG